jgi:glycosyltransferase involved in cell wall biosynthesis
MVSKMLKKENKLEKYRILHVVSKLPIGGVEKQLLNTVKKYNKDRFDVIICCINNGGDIADELKRLGYKVVILNRMKSHGFDIKAIIELYKLIKKEQIHILRTDQYHANLYGRIAGILAKVPVIIPVFHNVYNSPDKPKFHRRLLNFILSFFSDKLVAVSEAVAADIRFYDKVKANKIKVIYNGILFDEFKENYLKEDIRKKFNLPSCMLIGTVGRLTEQKGLEYLIKTLTNIDDVYLVIAGDGPLKNHLKQLAGSLGIKCIFMGMLSPEKVPLFLKSLDIFCFPSIWEGLGIALIEAMAAGLPIIASDIAPHREVLGDAGIYFPSKDIETLSKSIKRLLANKSERDELGEKAKKRAKIFSIDNSVRNFEKLYKEILTEKKIEK